MRPNHIACLRSAFPTSPPPPILLQSVKPWRPRVISWKCTDASSLTRKHAARSSAWINGYSLSALNWIKSTKPKNEERLAGQGTDHRLSWSVTLRKTTMVFKRGLSDRRQKQVARGASQDGKEHGAANKALAHMFLRRRSSVLL